MKPLDELGKTLTPEGKELALYRRDDAFQIRIDGLELMSNGAYDSEQALATEVCAELYDDARLLIGGLGMGFTLRAALDHLGPHARVHVVEVFDAVVEWNRGPLAHLSNHALDDPRVEVLVDDVADVIGRARAHYDAILLDVDNGPEGLVLDRNDRIYDRQGVLRAWQALRPNGILAVWSSSPARHFQARLDRCGFNTEHRRIRAQEGQGLHHSLYLGRRGEADPTPEADG